MPLAAKRPSKRLGRNLTVRISRSDRGRKAPRTHERIVGRFCAEVEKRALGAGALDGDASETLRLAVLRETKDRARTYARFCSTRFVDHLVGAGVASLPEPPAKAPTALDHPREEDDAYPRQQRALGEATIYHRPRFLERLMAFRLGETLGDLNAPSSTTAASRPDVSLHP